MSYKLLMEVQNHYKDKEALNKEISALELALKAAIRRLNLLRREPGGGGMVKTRVLEMDIQALKQRIMCWNNKPNIGTITIDADGTVTTSENPHGGGMVVYDHTLERQGLTRVFIRNSHFYWHPTNDTFLVDTFKRDRNNQPLWIAGGGEPDRGMYVMSAQGHFHLAKADPGVRHHSSLLAGANVSCAGEMKIRRGVLEWLSNGSGHYKPNLKNFLQVLHELYRPQNGILPPFTIHYYWELPGDNFDSRDVTIQELLSDPNIGLGLTGQNLALGFQEVYDFHNLMHAYSDIVMNAAEMQNLGLRFDANANPRGVYRIATGQWVSSREARTIINNGKIAGRADARNAAILAGRPKPKGVGREKLGHPLDQNAWRNS